MPENNTEPGDGFELKLAASAGEPPVRPIWRFVIAACFLQGADWVALAITSGVLDLHPHLQEALYRAIGVILLGAGFHFMLKTMDEVEGPMLPALGFPRKGALRELALGALIGIGLVTAAVLVMALAGGRGTTVRFASGWPMIRQLASVLVLLIVAATYEELSFRGYAFQRLVMAVGPAAAIAVFSAWFGVVHLWNPHAGGVLSWGFLNTVAVGALLAVAYLRTKALWMPIGIHFGWNFALGTLFGLPVSGLRMFSVMVETTMGGPKWLTGGSYGLEGSPLGSIVILVGFIPLCMLTRRQEPGI